MSFSSQVKEELSKLTNLANKELVKYELMGYLLSCNSTLLTTKTIRYATESEYNINRFSKLLANLSIEHKMEMDGNSFVITLKTKELIAIEVINNKIRIRLDEIPSRSEDKKALIRGAFLGAGSINNPENTYHLEMIFLAKENAEMIQQLLLLDFAINIKKLQRKEKYSLYLKEGEEISKLLALLGASRSVLAFEEIRVQKEMREKVNRLVNCKTANLNKTINASIEQIEAIRNLQKTGKFNKLNDNLKEIAVLRLANPDMSLVELGKQLNVPLGKSGVNYRLKKIVELANE